jgi:hypothetical protein
MHAFLIIGEIGKRIEELGKSLGAKILEFPIAKIDDTRDLNKLLRLSFNEKTLIVVRDIQNSTEEALNAFLKNLEEPQERIYFALTAPSEKSVLSTIVSRCQVIRGMRSEERGESKDSEKFMSMNKSEKLLYLDKIKDRNIAIEFINNLIFFLHDKKELNNMEILIKTLTNLKKNGNVSLHLTNLVVRM